MTWIDPKEKLPMNNETVNAVVSSESGRKFVIPVMYSIDQVYTAPYNQYPVWLDLHVRKTYKENEILLWQSLPELPEKFK